jgi:hypothetical protein
MCNYHVKLEVGSTKAEINDTVDTTDNFPEGQANQLAILLFRGMLGVGFTPATAYKALSKVLEGGGYAFTDGSEVQPQLSLVSLQRDNLNES